LKQIYQTLYIVKLPVYLDYNATTPVDERVLAEMLPWFTQNFGNAASRSHLYGWQAEEAVSIARMQVAKLLGAGEKDIVFTSGATESNNLAIKGVFEAFGKEKIILLPLPPSIKPSSMCVFIWSNLVQKLPY
jgi:cysteine desulfurase